MSATKKQTAVKWLVAELIKLGYLHSANYGNSLKVLNALEQAKAMEREQIKKDFIAGMEFIPVDPNRYNEDADQYYNETYD